MTTALTVISSMATRHILDDCARTYGHAVQVVSVGGVAAAERVRAGERFDVVVLGADALAALSGEGHVVAQSIRVLACSPSAVAVSAGAPRPAMLDEATLRALVAGAARIGISTGPSGKNVMTLLAGWALADGAARRIVQAPPGVPVARLLASGEADIGFQQFSELLGQPGIDIVGAVPGDLLPLTVFNAAIASQASDAAGAHAFIAYVAAAEASIRRHGMLPAEAPA